MIAVAIAAGSRVHETVGIALVDISEEMDAECLAYRINIIHFKKVVPRKWAYLKSRLVFTMALFNILIHSDGSKWTN